MKRLVVSILFVTQTVFAHDWAPTGIYGSSGLPVSSGSVAVPVEATALTTFDAYVVSGGVLVFTDNTVSLTDGAIATVRSGSVSFESGVTAAGALTFAADAARLEYSGAFLYDNETDATVLFANANIDDYEVVTSVLDANKTSIVNEALPMRPYYEIRSAGRLAVQLHTVNKLHNTAQCVKLVLFQSGDDIRGYVTYAGYNESGWSIDTDWDAVPFDAYVVRTPKDDATGGKIGLGINHLVLRKRNAVSVSNAFSSSDVTVGVGTPVVLDDVVAPTMTSIDLGEDAKLSMVAGASSFLNAGATFAAARTGSGILSFDTDAASASGCVSNATYLTWSKTPNILVAENVKLSAVTNVRGVVCKSVSVGNFIFFPNTKCYNYSYDGNVAICQMRGSGPFDGSNMVFCAEVHLQQSGNDVRAWIQKIGFKQIPGDDEYGQDINHTFTSAELTNQGIASSGAGAGMSVYGCGIDYAYSDAVFTVGSSADTETPFSGDVEIDGGAVATKVVVKGIAALSGANSQVDVKSGGKLYLNIPNNKGIAAKSIMVHKGGLLCAEASFNVPEGVYVYLEGGEYALGSVTAGDYDAHQYAAYLFFIDGARIFGARPRVSTWRDSFWRVRGCVPSACDCGIYLNPGDPTARKFNLDVADVTGNGDVDFSFNGPIDDLPGLAANYVCPLVKSGKGTVQFAAASGFKSPIQLTQGAIRFGTSGCLTNATPNTITMAKNTRIEAASGTENMVGAVTAAEDGTVGLSIEANAKLTLTSLTLGAATRLAVSGPENADNIGVRLLDGGPLSRIRYNGKSVFQDAEGWLHVGGGMMIIFK